MAVAGTRVMVWVAVSVDWACEVAVIVTTLLVGTVAGAVYNPPAVMAPVPVPLTDQFTSVLLRFRTVAVHCEVPRTVTLAGTQETVMVGVVAVVEEPLPQELRIAGAAISATNQTKRSQRTLALSKRKFGSSTTRPPSARSDFPEEFVIALCNFAGQR